MSDQKNINDFDPGDPLTALMLLGVISLIGGLAGGVIFVIFLSIAKVLLAALVKVLGFSIATRESILALDVYALAEPAVYVSAIITAVFCLYQFFNKNKNAGTLLLYIVICIVIVLLLNGWEKISGFAAG